MVEYQTSFSGRQWKQSRFFALCARLILGAVFIYASIDKITHPAAFAKVVYNYQILPGFLINLTAIVLPWLELLLGFSLITGIFLEGSVCAVMVLLVTFLSAIIFNLARGLDIHCGCFSTNTDGANNALMGWYVFRDSLFLLPAFYLFSHTFRVRSKITPPYLNTIDVKEKNQPKSNCSL